ncbi:MAG: helicase-exonuclease AddAB subunit AddA [Anaerovoracaceae bacterium]|nr:helicase-exonuclease AddAB subunit AddA [Anaerovoracaceae bacterium]
MEWTKEQREAIELRNKNILVAAAAGSGKTAVLVERIKQLMLRDGVSVDRMLIVTFTNAAAAEMKEKIRNALSGAVSSADDPAELRFLKKQADLIASANISTFHAFALEVIRRFFYIIKIEPDFRICDSTQETLLKEDAMDELLEQLFEEGDPRFYRFLKCYSGDRNENRFRETVRSAYSTIMSLPEPFRWLDENIESLRNGSVFDKGAGTYIFRSAESMIRKGAGGLSANLDLALEKGLDGLRQLTEDDMAAAAALLETLRLRDYRAAGEALGAFKLGRLDKRLYGGDENIKELVNTGRKGLKEAVKKIRENFFYGSEDELRREMSATYEPALYMGELLRKYDAVYRAKKDEKNMVDFSDIEHYAYEILKDREAADFYREKFEYIFIDEYQDNNVIQEALIDLIRRENNLFMVGDVKQSIYKFRLAEPEIFQQKYMRYKQDGRVSAAIDLNRNFRSKRTVIDFINYIFENIMDGYDDDASLYAGNPYADKAAPPPRLYLTGVPWKEDSDIDDELKNIIKAEKEALAAVKIIRDNLGAPFFDSKAGEERPLCKRDIVILMRSVKNYGDVFYKILTENDIPAYVDDNDGFFDTMEIETFLSLLYVIDNPAQDIKLITLLRSEIMGFSIEELVRIRTAHREGSYYEAFCGCADGEESREQNLGDKCRAALEKIRSWRQMSILMPLDKLIWKLLLDTGFYVAMGAMPAGSQRQANLRALTDKALVYRQNMRGSLYGFIRYIEAIRDKKVSMGQVKLLGEKDDLVRIMTIHKSKGLEFPAVILAGFCRRLNYAAAGRSPVFHKDIGIGFPLTDPEDHWYRVTLIQKMISSRVRFEEVEEEKRVLYVAMTRAMDRLFLLGILTDPDKETEAARSGGDTSYFSMTRKLLCRPEYMEMIDDDQLINLKKARRRDAGAAGKLIESCAGMPVSGEVAARMTFTYPYAAETKTRTKYSVSSLAGGEQRRETDLREPLFAAGEKSLGAAERGTAYHTVLEHLDIKKAGEDESYIDDLLRKMTEEEMITEAEARIIDVKKIRAFADSSVGARMAASGNIQREKRFNYLTERDGVKTIVRGKIDCFFEEDGGWVLLDYKTGSAADAAAGRDEKIAEKYRTQIELYRQALEAATGRKVKEAYLYMTDAGRFIKI